MAGVAIPGLDIIPASWNETVHSGVEEIGVFHPDHPFRISAGCKYGKCQDISNFEYKENVSRSSSIRFICEDKIREVKVYLEEYEDTKKDEEYLSNFVHKIETLKLFNYDHENVIKFHGVTSSSVPNEREFLIYEFCEFLLCDILEKEVEIIYDENRVNYIMLQLLRALEYLHSQNIMHRNVNPNSIMFTSSGVLKLGNFMDIKKTPANGCFPVNTEYGYQAPELLLKVKEHDCTVDIWSAGCIYAELLMRKSLFHDKKFLLQSLAPKVIREKVVRKIFQVLGTPNNNTWPSFCELPAFKRLIIKNRHEYNCLKILFEKSNTLLSSSSLDLLKGMLMYPSHRFDVARCLEHPHLQETKVEKERDEINIAVALRQYLFKSLSQTSLNLIPPESIKKEKLEN